jgi:hypothetical protein
MTDLKQSRRLKKFAQAEKFASELYSRRRDFRHVNEIYDLVKKKFPRNEFIDQAISAAAESWNYHNEVYNWMDELRGKIGYFTYEELKYARERVK